jgi:hypothetical protein
VTRGNAQLDVFGAGRRRAQQTQQAHQQGGFETIDHECLLWLLKFHRLIYTLNNKASNT